MNFCQQSATMSDIFQNLKDELEEFCVSAEENVILKMQEFCFAYTLQADDLVSSWIAFSATKHVDMPLTLDNLAQFEKEDLVKKNKTSKSRNSSAKKTPSAKVYNSSTIDVLDIYDASEQVTPERKKTRTVGTPSSLSLSQATPSTKYATRKAPGSIVCTFGNGEGATWDVSQKLLCDVMPYAEETALKGHYSYMFEKFRDYASVLNDIIEDAAELYKKTDATVQWSPVHLPAVDTISVIGRICSEDGNKINAQSVMLEGSYETSSGRIIALNVNELEKFSLFPGQVIAGEGVNSLGKKLILKKLFEEVPLPFPKDVPNFAAHGGDLVVVIAAGPFTTADSISYEPLIDLLNNLKKNKPHLCILCGPFVDIRQEEIQNDSLAETYEDIFQDMVKTIMNALDDVSVVLVPSIHDAHHESIYPTPPFNNKFAFKNLYLASDPCFLNIDGVVFGITSTDILMHLGKQEIHLSPQPSDRLGRLCRHLLTQKSFYPLYPPAEDINIDYLRYEIHCTMPITPHVLIVPSSLRYFIKNVNGCCCINPERLTKSCIGGTFARMRIASVDPGSFNGSIIDYIYSEIVKI